MKILWLCLLAICGAGSAQAYPNPEFIGLDNAAQLGAYINSNMLQIVQSNAELAKIAVPNSYYFFVTTQVVIQSFGDDVDQGKKPIATLYVTSEKLNCARNIFGKVKTDVWGEHRQWTFTLEPSIQCKAR